MISSADHFLMGQFVQEKQAVYISKGLSHVTGGRGVRVDQEVRKNSPSHQGMPKTNI